MACGREVQGVHRTPGPGLEEPGLRGPGRVQVFALSFGVAPGGIFMGLNLSEDLGLHLISGKNRTEFQ